MRYEMNNTVLGYMEKYGIYQPYKVKGNTLTYYSFYDEGIYKVTVNVKTGYYKRKRLRYKRVPKFLKSSEGTLYNYKVG